MSNIVKCTRPLLYNDPDRTEYSYWQHGTGFIIRYGNHYFIVTARHNIRSEDDLSKLRVFKESDPDGPFSFNTEEESDLFVTPIGYHRIMDRELEEIVGNNDITDTALIEIEAQSIIGNNFFDLPVAPIPDNPRLIFFSDLHRGEELLISGFPSQANKIEYDTSYVTFNRHVLSGRFMPCDGFLDIASIDMSESQSQLEDYDGLSGSPVFSVNGDCPKLAGVVTRGSVSSRKIYFVTSWVLAMNLMMADMYGDFFGLYSQ